MRDNLFLFCVVLSGGRVTFHTVNGNSLSVSYMVPLAEIIKSHFEQNYFVSILCVYSLLLANLCLHHKIVWGASVAPSPFCFLSPLYIAHNVAFRQKYNNF